MVYDDRSSSILTIGFPETYNRLNSAKVFEVSQVVGLTSCMCSGKI